MVFFNLGKRGLNDLLSEMVEVSASGRTGKSIDLVQCILPEMALNLATRGSPRETRFPPRAVRACFRIAVVFPVTFAAGGLMCQLLLFRTDVGVVFGIVNKTVLSKVFSLEGVTLVSNDSSNFLGCQLVGYSGVVVPGFQRTVLDFTVHHEELLHDAIAAAEDAEGVEAGVVEHYGSDRALLLLELNQHVVPIVIGDRCGNDQLLEPVLADDFAHKRRLRAAQRNVPETGDHIVVGVDALADTITPSPSENR